MFFRRAFVFLILLSVFCSGQGDVCSLYSSPPSVTGINLFDYTSFSASTPLIKTWTTIEGTKLRLAAQETNGGTVGYVWHNTRERIADGFVSAFTFTISTPTPSTAGDGFTYFIQNDRVENLNGGTGSKLGAFGIKNSIAIKFDLCPNRPAHPCGTQTVALAMINSTFGTLSPSPLISLSGVNLINLVDGLPHTVIVTYAGRVMGESALLRVELDGRNLFGNVVVGDLSGPKLFSDRFAYFGFTASMSWLDTANIDVLNWRTDMVPSDTEVLGYKANSNVSFVFDTVATFVVQMRDSCKLPLTTTLPANVTATLFQVPAPGTNPLDYVLLKGNVTASTNGQYEVRFNLPTYVGAWDLDILVNGVRSEGMPWLNGVQTVYPPPPAPPEFPIWALVLLLCLILLIILTLGYVVYRLHRYRKKLKENAEFIEAGKEQAKLDRLEDGIKYQANPMVGTLDDLKEQLRKNEEELARLKHLGELGDQQSFTIASLQKQRNDLMEEMGRLKKEEQEEELRKKNEEKALQAGSRAKKEFGREQI